MRKIKISVIFFLSVLLISCASRKEPPPVIPELPADNGVDVATIKLAETAQSVDSSLLDLARIQAVATPPIPDNYPDLGIENLQNRISVDWSGPIDQLVNNIARENGYEVNALGTPPPIPVLVSITARDATSIQVLRDIDYQAGNNAHLQIYPDNKIIELRYGQN